MDPFEAWARAEQAGQFPWADTLLNRVCKGDKERFAVVIRLMKEAFIAGQAYSNDKIIGGADVWAKAAELRKRGS